MKKIILLGTLLIAFSACNPVNTDEIIRQAGNPFKEYSIPDKNLAEGVEKGILETEAQKNGLDLERSSAHLISFTKIGTYGKGEVRILGNLTEEKLKELKKKNSKKNGIVTYTCYFEYSFKNGSYTWHTDYTE